MIRLSMGRIPATRNAGRPALIVAIAAAVLTGAVALSYWREWRAAVAAAHHLAVAELARARKELTSLPELLDSAEVRTRRASGLISRMIPWNDSDASTALMGTLADLSRDHSLFVERMEPLADSAMYRVVTSASVEVI